MTPDPPLARRLKSLDLAEPFSFFPFEDDALHDFNSGILTTYPGNQDEDERFAFAVSRWLAQSPPGLGRVMVLEESIAGYSDGWAVRHRAGHPDEMVHLGDTLYWIGHAGDDEARILNRIREVRGFSGIGVLSSPPADALTALDLEIRDLEVLVAHAVAVVVRAWDDEGYLIAPVAGSNIREQLNFAPLDEPRGEHA